MFQPKRIGDELFLDGAVRSATNADLIVNEGHEVVLISSPMTKPGRGIIRARARRQLDQEASKLRAAGTRVVIVEPNEELARGAEGFPRTNHEAGPRIIERVADYTADLILANR